MKKVILSLTIIGVLAVTACNNVSNTNKQPEGTTLSIEKVAGRYQGMIPCESCPGNNIILSLGSDGTFVKLEKYLGNQESSIEKGAFKQDGNKVTLDDKDQMSLLLTGNVLYILDKDQKKQKGKQGLNYQLAKASHDAEIAEALTHQIYKSENGTLYKVSMYTAAGKKYAALKTSAGTDTLTAEGEGYRNNQYTLRRADAGLVLTEKGKQQRLGLQSPVNYTYKNGNQYLDVSYYTTGSENFVILLSNDGIALRLPQTAASGQNTEYSANNSSWKVNEKKGILNTKNGETVYTELVNSK